jgi:FeS assembly SUF system protein
MFSLFNKLTGRGDAPAEPSPASAAGAPEMTSSAGGSAPAAAVAEPPAGVGLNVDALLAPSHAPVAAEPTFGAVDAERTETLKPAIVAAIGTVFDPEIPVNIYELGLIYEIAADAQSRVRVLMTLTSPACPSAQQLPSEVRYKVKAVEGVADCTVEIVWEPPWTKDMMSEAAKLSLGMF